LPEFVLPYLRSSLAVIAIFLITRLLRAQTLHGANQAAPPPISYQRGQFWIRRFRAQAETLCAALAALTKPAAAPSFVQRALAMLESTGWIAAHRFPLSPAGLAPRSGSRRPPRRIVFLRRARLSRPTHHLHGTARPFSLRFETGEKLHG
jgi:hypothetical protein